MAQEAMPWDEYQSTPATGQGVVIQPKGPTATEQTKVGIDVSSEERSGRKEQFDNAKTLRDEFRKSEESKNYEVVMRQFSSALGAKANPTGDQALITAYAKMLDPASVVREAEFNIVQAGDSAIGKQVARLQKEFGIDESGLIRPEVRNRVLTEMKNLTDNYRQSYDRVRTDYEGLAGSYRIDPKLVLGSRIDDPYLPKVEKAWKEKGIDQTSDQTLAISGGEQFSTETDKAIADAVNQVIAQGGGVQELVAAAQGAGGQVQPEDLAAFQQAVEARSKGQSVTFNPQQSGRRSPIAQAAGEALMTPAGTALTGAVNAVGMGALSQFAGDQVQGLEALNPKAALTGEVIGSALGTAGLAKGAGAALGAVAPSLAGRLAGGGLAGAAGRELATDVAYGGLYAANTGEDIATGAALGAVGSLGGQALGAGVRRAAPAIGRMLGREGGEVVPPVGGVPEAPITRNRLYSEKIMGPEYQAGDALPKYGMRNISGPDELQDIIESGFVRSRKEGGAKYYTMTDADVPAAGNVNTGKPIIRIKSENIPEGRAARAEDVQVWNNETKGWDDLIPSGGSAPRPNAAPLTEEPFAPTTTTFRGGGAEGTSLETQRLSQAEGLPVPVELTRGAASRDAEQLAFEKEHLYGALGGPLRKRAEENNLQVLENFDRFIDQTGAKATENIADSGNAVIKALSNGFQAAKNKVNVAYKRAEASEGAQEPVDYADLKSFIDGQDEATKELAPVLKSVQQQIAKNDPEGTGQITVATMENIRKLISKNAQQGTPSSVYGGEMKVIIDSLTEGKGGELYNKARKLRVEQARKFENRAIVARLVTNVKNMDDPKVAADEVFKKSIMNESPEDIKFLRQTLRTTGPEGRQAWNELQGATVRDIAKKATANTRKTADNLDVVSADGLNKAIKALDENGRLDTIFNPKMARQLRDLRDVVMYVNTVPPGTSINNSGTARTIAAMMGEMTITGGASAYLTGSAVPVPIVTGLKMMMKASKDKEIQKKIARSLLPKDAQ